MIVMPPAKSDDRSRWERLADGVRHPVVWVRATAGDGPIYALLILFGLNLVDEFDRTGFSVLMPNIRDAFGLSNTAILSILGVVGFFALLLSVPISMFADRTNRVRMMIIGFALFTVFSAMTGLIPTVWWALLFVRLGTGIGQGTSLPTHNSLLADYFDIPYRPGVFSFHRAANVVGGMVGPLAFGFIAQAYGWRVPFLIMAIPCAILVLFAFGLKEPKRGHFERKAMGASAEVVDLEEPAPSLEEAYRMVWKIRSLRRMFAAFPFFAAALIGFGSLASLLYQEVFNLDEAQRGTIEFLVQPMEFIGLVAGGIVGTKLIRRSISLLVRQVTVVAFIASGGAALFALAPNIAVAFLGRSIIAISLGSVVPTLFAALALAIPARARTSGFSLGALWFIPGLLMLPIVGWISDTIGIRTGMLIMTPVFLLAGLIVASAGKFLENDIKNVWTATAARSELLYERRQGTIKQLLVRNLDVSYGDVQILFNVDFEVEQGSIIALLGTNGAGKSTLLKAITGVVQPSNGAVIFDGRDITDAPPHEIASLGIAMVPGGQGVFPTLTVRENLKVASWLEKDKARAKDRIDLVQQMFPILNERMDDAAANLSGGQQQMLGLSMAFLAEPKLLAIDELSLGLAPVVVEQLLAIVRAIRDQGTTIILVEQSVNVALTLAETAYFMEKGEIRFHGPTKELLERPDVLRSVFLEGASKTMSSAGGMDAPAVDAPADRVGAPTEQPAGAGSHAPAAIGSESLDAAGGGAGGAEATSARADAQSVLGHPGQGGGNGSGDERLESFLSPPGPAEGRVERARTALTGSAGPPEGAPVLVPEVLVGPGKAALAVDGLSVRFGGIRAVNGVTLAVEPAEIVGIIGPNGAGKTTLFDLISGFTSADAGRVILGGSDISHLAPDGRARRGLGRSFQDARLFPALTVEETLAVALERWVDVKDPLNAALRLPAQQDSEIKVKERVDELVELMGIESFRSKFVRELSTGSRRVVDIACVLAHHPSVVLLDEPSSGIAQKESEALRPLLLRIRENLGASLIVIEHDMPLIASVSDRLIALDQGHVVTVGEPDAVLSHPEVVESYLGNTREVIERSGAAG